MVDYATGRTSENVVDKRTNVPGAGLNAHGNKDPERIKRNIKRMVDQNAPEEDIDAYLSSEGMTPEKLRGSAAAPTESADNPRENWSPEEKQAYQEQRELYDKNPSLKPGYAARAAQSASLGFADEISAGLETVLETPFTNKTGGFRSRFNQNMAKQAAGLDVMNEETDGAGGFVADIAGGFGMGAPRAVGNAMAQAATAPARGQLSKDLIKYGAAYGGAHGFGTAEGGVVDRLAAVPEAAAYGAAGSLVFGHALNKGVNTMAKYRQNRTVRAEDAQARAAEMQDAGISDPLPAAVSGNAMSEAATRGAGATFVGGPIRNKVAQNVEQLQGRFNAMLDAQTGGRSSDELGREAQGVLEHQLTGRSIPAEDMNSVSAEALQDIVGGPLPDHYRPAPIKVEPVQPKPVADVTPDEYLDSLREGVPPVRPNYPAEELPRDIKLEDFAPPQPSAAAPDEVAQRYLEVKTARDNAAREYSQATKEIDAGGAEAAIGGALKRQTEAFNAHMAAEDEISKIMKQFEGDPMGTDIASKTVSRARRQTEIDRMLVDRATRPPGERRVDPVNPQIAAKRAEMDQARSKYETEAKAFADEQTKLADDLHRAGFEVDEWSKTHGFFALRRRGLLSAAHDPIEYHPSGRPAKSSEDSYDRAAARQGGRKPRYKDDEQAKAFKAAADDIKYGRNSADPLAMRFAQNREAGKRIEKMREDLSKREKDIAAAEKADAEAAAKEKTDAETKQRQEYEKALEAENERVRTVNETNRALAEDAAAAETERLRQAAVEPHRERAASAAQARTNQLRRKAEDDAKAETAKLQKEAEEAQRLDLEERKRNAPPKKPLGSSREHTYVTEADAGYEMGRRHTPGIQRNPMGAPGRPTNTSKLITAIANEARSSGRLPGFKGSITDETGRLRGDVRQLLADDFGNDVAQRISYLVERRARGQFSPGIKGLHDIKTLIGRELQQAGKYREPGMPRGPSETALSRLYKAFSNDIDGIRDIGPGGQQATELRHHQDDEYGKLIGDLKRPLGQLFKDGVSPVQALDRLVAGAKKGDLDMLRPYMRVMREKDDPLRAAASIVQHTVRGEKDFAGIMKALGEIRPETRDVLFVGKDGQEYRAALERLEKVGKMLEPYAGLAKKQGGVLKQAVHPSTLVTAAAFYHQFWPALVTTAGVAAASKFLASPRYLNWLTKIPDVTKGGLQGKDALRHLSRLTGITASDGEFGGEILQAVGSMFFTPANAQDAKQILRERFDEKAEERESGVRDLDTGAKGFNQMYGPGADMLLRRDPDNPGKTLPPMTTKEFRNNLSMLDGKAVRAFDELNALSKELGKELGHELPDEWDLYALDPDFEDVEALGPERARRFMELSGAIKDYLIDDKPIKDNMLAPQIWPPKAKNKSSIPEDKGANWGAPMMLGGPKHHSHSQPRNKKTGQFMNYGNQDRMSANVEDRRVAMASSNPEIDGEIEFIRNAYRKRGEELTPDEEAWLRDGFEQNGPGWDPGYEDPYPGAGNWQPSQHLSNNAMRNGASGMPPGMSRGGPVRGNAMRAFGGR